MPENPRPTAHFNTQVLIIFLILATIALTLGHFVLMNGARESYREVIGTNFGQRADYAQNLLIQHLQQLSAHVENLAALPDVQRAVRESNADKLTEKQREDRIREIDDRWRALNMQQSRLLRDILENPASQFLRELNLVVATFREMLVTDVHGRLVAASNKTTDYFQSDELWWARPTWMVSAVASSAIFSSMRASTFTA